MTGIPGIITMRIGDADVSVPAEAAARAYLRQRLEEPAAQTIAARLDLLKKERPAIGSKGLFGIYAGLVRAERDYPDGILEALEEAPKAMRADVFESANSYFGILRSAPASHRDRARLARILRRRGFAVDRGFTKTFRHG